MQPPSPSLGYVNAWPTSWRGLCGWTFMDLDIDIERDPILAHATKLSHPKLLETHQPDHPIGSLNLFAGMILRAPSSCSSTKCFANASEAMI